MKSFIKLVKTEEENNYTLALIMQDETTKGSSSPFATFDQETKITAINIKTGETIPKELLDIGDTSEKVSLKVDGKVIKLTPTIRTGINYTESQLAALGDFVVETMPKEEAEGILKDAAYKEFEAQAIEALGLRAGDDTSDLYGMLKTYEGQKHILVTGDAGLGKTYIVSKFAEEEDRQVFFKALDNGTETIDLVGHLIKVSDGSFPWKDGVVTQAFRAAARGEKVLLFLDELLRAPEKELSLLVGCLTPDSRGKLVLRTGRALEDTLTDGVVEEEVIETDIEHLWCVATTNQGRGYHTGKIDMALKDRFRIFEQTMSIETSKEIAINVLKATDYGKKLSDTAVTATIDKLYKVVEAVANHVEGDGKLKQYITIRHITEVINTSRKLKDLKSRMMDLVSNLVMIDSSGKLNVEQKEIIYSYIKTHLKV
jgi:hypothetical protein